MSVQVGSYGYVLSLESGLDLSTATAINLLIKPPAAGATVTKSIPISAVVDKAAGKIGYQVVIGDFPIPGVYQLQVQDASAGRSIFSRVTSLVLESNLV